MKKHVDNIEPTKEQLERRKQSEEYCESCEIPIYSNPNALFVDSDDAVKIRTHDEVVDRTLALCFIGLKSEGLEQSDLEQIDKEYSITSKLTEIEKTYVNASEPTEQQKIDANWRYESMHVMLWALSFHDTLEYPSFLCDVTTDVKTIYNFTEQEFRQTAKLRSKKEILDEADLALRLNWACVNSKIKNEDPPSSLDSSIVAERHHSLNWLINYLDQDWDNVSTDT